MTWMNRLKLLVGLVAVVAVVGACTWVFTLRQSAATSASATIVAQSYPVGTDYAGTVTAVHVKAGDRVRAGEPLLSVQSASLRSDLTRGLVTRSSVGYSATSKGRITFTSPVDGTVARLTPVEGGFVQPGATLATIDEAGSLTVAAKVLLSPTDYSRLATGSSASVILPNQTVLSGRVERIAVATTASGEAQAQVTVTSRHLAEGAEHGIVAPGTPVTARVRLRADGPLAGLEDAGTALLRKVGL